MTQTMCWCGLTIGNDPDVERDAARYRWLRNNPQWIGYDADFRPDEVDGVIDAAMRPTVSAPEEQTK